MDKIKATVKPLYAQGASIVVTLLLWILLVVTVAKDEFATSPSAKVGWGKIGKGAVGGYGLIIVSFGSAETWQQATYILLIFTIIFQVIALASHGLFFKKPNLKPKLFIALIVFNALTFLISAIALGLWDANGATTGMSRGVSYQCISACIFFEILNFILLALLKIVGGTV